MSDLDLFFIVCLACCGVSVLIWAVCVCNFMIKDLRKSESEES